MGVRTYKANLPKITMITAVGAPPSPHPTFPHLHHLDPTDRAAAGRAAAGGQPAGAADEIISHVYLCMLYIYISLSLSLYIYIYIYRRSNHMSCRLDRLCPLA